VSSYASSNAGSLAQGVLRFNAANGSPLGVLAPVSTGKRVDDPEGITIGPDGNLYVMVNGPSGSHTSSVYRYNGTTEPL